MRKRVHRGQLIRRIGKAYTLDNGIAVDLSELRDTMNACTGRATPTEFAFESMLEKIRAGYPSPEHPI